MLGNALTTAAPPKVCRNFRRGSFLATDKCGAYYTSSRTNMSIAAARKRYFEFVSLSLVLGLAAAIATLVFFGWLADEVLEGETRHFDDVTRAAVHTLASPALTTVMRGISFLGSTLFLTHDAEARLSPSASHSIFRSHTAGNIQFPEWSFTRELLLLRRSRCDSFGPHKE